MVRRIWAHFDGKVIVPHEPLDLPVDLPLQVQLIAPVDEDRSLGETGAALAEAAWGIEDFSDWEKGIV